MNLSLTSVLFSEQFFFWFVAVTLLCLESEEQKPSRTTFSPLENMVERGQKCFKCEKKIFHPIAELKQSSQHWADHKRKNNLKLWDKGGRKKRKIWYNGKIWNQTVKEIEMSRNAPRASKWPPQDGQPRNKRGRIRKTKNKRGWPNVTFGAQKLQYVGCSSRTTSWLLSTAFNAVILLSPSQSLYSQFCKDMTACQRVLLKLGTIHPTSWSFLLHQSHCSFIGRKQREMEREESSARVS